MEVKLPVRVELKYKVRTLCGEAAEHIGGRLMSKLRLRLNEGETTPKGIRFSNLFIQTLDCHSRHFGMLQQLSKGVIYDTKRLLSVL